jgi:large subunit ribosomal protein L7A
MNTDVDNLSRLKGQNKVVGIKQSAKAVADGDAVLAYIADGVESRIRTPFIRLCNEKNVPIIRVPSGKELGGACGIDVPASVAVVLREVRA